MSAIQPQPFPSRVAPSTEVLVDGPVRVVRSVCTAGRASAPYAEVHSAWSLSYVCRGSFGYHCRGQTWELVAGGLLAGRRGDEYVCSHEHHDEGDVCLSFILEEDVADEFADDRARDSHGLPPVAGLSTLGALAESAADGELGIGLEEIAVALLSRYTAIRTGCEGTRRPPLPGERRRIVHTAHWLDRHHAEELSLHDAARHAGLSSYHFLRTFRAVLDVTPHQYLLRARLRHAARLLAGGDDTVTAIALEVGFADLSNFVRSFRRATGLAPGAFRALARGHAPGVRSRLHSDPRHQPLTARGLNEAET